MQPGCRAVSVNPSIVNKAHFASPLQPGCMAPSVNPSMKALIEAFRRCVAEVSPLLHCQTLPPPHIANFAEYKVGWLQVFEANWCTSAYQC